METAALIFLLLVNGALFLVGNPATIVVGALGMAATLYVAFGV